MASEIKLFEMNKKDMQHLMKYSKVILFVSVLISSLSTLLFYIYSIRQANTKQAPVPNAFVLAELIFNVFIALLTLSAIYIHLRRHQSLEDRQKQFNRVLLILLISSLIFSIPFRSLAEIVRRKDGFPNWVFLMCRDVVAAAGSGLLFIFLWSYPSIWAELPEGTARPYKACVCVFYAVVRFALSFICQIHFEPLPIQHLFSLAGILVRDNDIDLKFISFISILVLSAIECMLIFYVYWNYTSCTTVLYTSHDPSKQQSIIALWYYGRALVLLCVGIFAAAVARIVSPATYTINLLRQTGIVVLSGSIGDSAISLVVFSYALREAYVHSVTHEQDLSFVLSFFLGCGSSKSEDNESKELDSNLLYRIADERDPQNEDPIPQPNTFSFESAMLLFNSAWLSTTYAARGMKPLTPSDFGRPMCAVRAVVSDANHTVVAIVLERMDRLIIAFKPLLPLVDKRDDLRYVMKTDFWRSLSNPSDDQELLPLKDMDVPLAKAFKPCRLHHGYSKAYSFIQSDLHAHVRDLTMDTSRPLYVTGFGSGGALATICSFDLSLRKISDSHAVSLYTYGSPRTMNSDMVSLFETTVACRWRCVVAGDCNSVKPTHSLYRHFTKVATFTRSGHLALENDRVYKWWQSEVSAHPMHKISAYYCAFAKWHKSYHVKGSIDLWNWQVDKAVAALFLEDTSPTDLMCTADFMLESPITDVEAKSLRTLGEPLGWHSSPVDDVIAFKR